MTPKTDPEVVVVETPVLPSKRQVYATLAGAGVTIALGVVTQVAIAKITGKILEKTEKPTTESE
jgi:hypothetical protein